MSRHNASVNPPAAHHSTTKDYQGFQKLNEYEKVIHAYKNCTWNCYPIMSDNKINKSYEGKLEEQKSTLIITNLRIVLQNNDTTSTTSTTTTQAKNQLTIEYPQVIFDKSKIKRNSQIAIKDLPPELIIPWFGENYLLLRFQPGKQQPNLNYVYQWVLELYCKTDIFSLKDCFSKVILDSRMPKDPCPTNANTTTNSEENIDPLPIYEP